MKSLRNKVQLIGNLGKAPEVINLESGRQLAKFTLATNETYRNKEGEKVTETQWHNIVTWGNTATIAEKYLDKGERVALEGKLVTRSYEDKEGNKRYVTEIVAHDLLMLGGKKEQLPF